MTANQFTIQYTDEYPPYTDNVKTRTPSTCARCPDSLTDLKIYETTWGDNGCLRDDDYLAEHRGSRAHSLPQ